MHLLFFITRLNFSGIERSIVPVIATRQKLTIIDVPAMVSGINEVRMFYSGKNSMDHLPNAIENLQVASDMAYRLWVEVLMGP